MKQVCKYCKRDTAKAGGATIDHIIPKSMFGTNKKDNLTIACYECNQFKAGMSLREWLHEITILMKYKATPLPFNYTICILGQIKRTLKHLI